MAREITSLGAVRRPLFLLVLAVVAAGCGSGRSASTTTTAPPNPAQAAGGGRTIYHGTEWSVVVKGGQATALQLVGGQWRPDRSGRVKVTFLGPRGTVAPVFQMAAELSAKTPLVESALWVDGVELLEKGGGTGESAKKFTIYGTPDRRLKPGRHVAVAYGRTATTGTAVAWTFRVV